MLLAVLKVPFWFLGTAIALQLLVAVASGFVGALFARANPVYNGALAGSVGAGVLFLWLEAVAPGSGEFSYVWSFVIATLLALLGALVAVFAWPRRGL